MPATEYTALTVGETDTDSPVTTGLMSKIRTNDAGFNNGNGFNDDIILERHIAAGAVHQAQLDTSVQNATFTGNVGTESEVSNSFNLTSPDYTAGIKYRWYTNVFAGSGYVSLSGGRSGESGGVSSIYNAFHRTLNAIRGNPSTNFSGTISIDIDINYINSSPPYDLGEGEVPLFVFALLDADDNIVGMHNDASPPWVYNGPTKAVTEYKKNGKPYLKKWTIDEESGLLFEEEVEITQEVKNADIDIIPHPFLTKDGQRVVMIDPVSTLELCELCKAGERVNEIFINDYLRLGDQVTRKGPKSVPILSYKWKNSKTRAGEMVKDRRLKRGAFDANQNNPKP